MKYNDNHEATIGHLLFALGVLLVLAAGYTHWAGSADAGRYLAVGLCAIAFTWVPSLAARLVARVRSHLVEPVSYWLDDCLRRHHRHGVFFRWQLERRWRNEARW